MKTLLLMRHAEAGPVGRHGDKGRRLTARGLEAAMTMGRFLDRSGHLPDLALVSDSQRTRETVDALGSALRLQPQVEFDLAIYRGDRDELLDHIRTRGATAHCILVVGHNPAIADLAETLAGSEAAAAWHGFPTAAVAIFAVQSDGWERLGPDCTTLERFVTPALLAGGM